MLWIFATLGAVAAQTARNAAQSALTSELGALGASYVRFLYGLPFALVFLAIASILAGAPPPPVSAPFLWFTVFGALAQIGATAFLLMALRARSFSVGIALSKTEPIQVAVFGFLVLGDVLTPLGALAVALATLGVTLTAVRPGDRLDDLAPALQGMLSGALFAVAAVAFRGAILALESDAFYLAASTALVWSLALQTFALGAWLLVFDRRALSGAFRLWRPSLFAGFAGALASQLWFIGFSLTNAANVRTLGLLEVFAAQIVSRRVFRQRVSWREIAGACLIMAGVAMLLLAPAR